MKIHSRDLNDSDLIKMRKILLEDGPNNWNFLTNESFNHQFQLIKEGKALAVLAEDDEIVGFAVLIFREHSPEKLEKYAKLSSLDYINDVVVSRTRSGQGIGNKLLNECIVIAKNRASEAVYIERHEENLASAGMMLKAGFEIVETYYDPSKRFVGSKSTTVLKKYT